MDILGFSEAELFAFILVVLRMASLFAFAPVFSTQFIPAQVKAALVLGLGLGLTALGAAPPVAVPATTAGVAALAGQEVLLGMLTGLVAQFVFAAVQFGGQVVGFQMGLGIVSVMDPQFETQISVISQLEFLLAVLLFFGVVGYRLLLEAFARNLSAVPPGHVAVGATVVEAVVRLSGEIFRLGLQVAAPVVVTVFCTQVILGVFARSVPQMNVLVVGFPLKIMVGFAVIGLSLPYWGRVFLRALEATFRALDGLGAALG